MATNMIKQVIKYKKSIINPKNKDKRCFLWSVLIGLYNKEIKNHEKGEIYNYRKYVN